MTKTRALPAIAAFSLLSGLGGVLYAQSARSAGDGASQDALVAEIRGLRADISQIARTSIRTQLLVARLQLQEQRILTVDRQLRDVESLLVTIRQELAEDQIRVTQLEQSASQAPDEGERRAIRQVIPQAKAQIGLKQQREQELRTQQAELASAVNDEQGRWIGFNDRLDELERSLAVP